MVHLRSIFQPFALAALVVMTALAASGSGVAAGEKLAIKGYDPVAYFTVSHPVLGKPELAYSWNEAQWQFSTPANRDAFAADPDR